MSKTSKKPSKIKWTFDEYESPFKDYKSPFEDAVPLTEAFDSKPKKKKKRQGG